MEIKWRILDSELIRVTRIANELTNLLRRDATLFSRIKPRTLRWIKKQDQLAIEAKDAKDAMLIINKRRREALAKLTKKEQELLGLSNSDADEDPE